MCAFDYLLFIIAQLLHISCLPFMYIAYIVFTIATYYPQQGKGITLYPLPQEFLHLLHSIPHSLLLCLLWNNVVWLWLYYLCCVYRMRSTISNRVHLHYMHVLYKVSNTSRISTQMPTISYNDVASIQQYSMLGTHCIGKAAQCLPNYYSPRSGRVSESSVNSVWLFQPMRLTYVRDYSNQSNQLADWIKSNENSIYPTVCLVPYGHVTFINLCLTAGCSQLHSTL